MKPRDLRDVEVEVNEIDHSMTCEDEECREVKIDKKIRPLIVALRRWRINTLESCEGHRIPYGFRSTYPFVRFPIEDEPIVRKLMGVYQKKDEWVIETTNTGNYLLLHPLIKKPEEAGWAGWKLFVIPHPFLGTYQKAVKELTEWLQTIPEDFFEDKQ